MNALIARPTAHWRATASDWRCAAAAEIVGDRTSGTIVMGAEPARAGAHVHPAAFARDAFKSAMPSSFLCLLLSRLPPSTLRAIFSARAARSLVFRSVFCRTGAIAQPLSPLRPPSPSPPLRAERWPPPTIANPADTRFERVPTATDSAAPDRPRRIEIRLQCSRESLNDQAISFTGETRLCNYLARPRLWVRTPTPLVGGARRSPAKSRRCSISQYR